MSERHAAFLGSINVGGNRLAMAELRDALGEAGLAKVETVVASGNVLFDAAGADAALAARIEALLLERFSIKSFAAVRTRGEVAASIADNPFATDGAENFVHTQFLEGQPSRAQFAQLLADHAGRGAERLALGDRALYIDFVEGAGNSKLTGAFIEKRLGCRGTARNMRSLKRILEKMDS